MLKIPPVSLLVSFHNILLRQHGYTTSPSSKAKFPIQLLLESIATHQIQWSYSTKRLIDNVKGFAIFKCRAAGSLQIYFLVVSRRAKLHNDVYNYILRDDDGDST